MLKSVLENIAKVGRKVESGAHLTSELQDKLEHLRINGYVTFEHYVGTPEFENLKQDYIQRIEKKLEFKTPCLAQSKIDPVKHKKLIENNFLASNQELTEIGLTFNKADVKSYSQVLADFLPSTLSLDIPDDYKYLNIWLDSDLIQVVESYMGFTPILTEAYVRRNFPARIPVMNHYWHRDRNHKKHLLKAFIFFSDCTLKTGPHHYIAGSINDNILNDKNYYTDEEVASAYPPGSGKEIVSVVPAGTIILEDTRGLHKAGLPMEGHRDLGFSVFLPPVAVKPSRPLYNISRNTYNQLSDKQAKFISLGNVC